MNSDEKAAAEKSLKEFFRSRPDCLKVIMDRAGVHRTVFNPDSSRVTDFNLGAQSVGLWLRTLTIDKE